MKLSETLSPELKKALYDELKAEFETADVVKLTLELSKLSPEDRASLMERVKPDTGGEYAKMITGYLAEKFPKE